jgi:uncharacterized protein YkwD
MTPRRATPLGLALALATATAALAAAGARAGGPTALPHTNMQLASIQVIARAPAFEAELLAAVNRVRATRSLPALRASAPLNAAAVQHSLQMARLGYFDHSSANGTRACSRVCPRP